jgi:outer membrane protein insertion porin family
LASVKTYRLITIGLWAFLLIAISGCKVTKNFTADQTLLTHLKIKVLNEQNIQQRQKASQDLKHVAAQQPNKRVFGFLPFKLWLYTAANHKKETKIKWWIKNKVGEAPVIYDPDLADKSDNLMMYYFQNSGYQNAQVTHQINTKRKKTTITYTVKKGPLWRLGDINFSAGPYLTDSITQSRFKQTKLHTGDKFDVTTLKAEQDRIVNDLRNIGFFYFSKDYVTFDCDTNIKPQTVNVNIRITQPSDSAPHQQYRINEIYITTDFGAELSGGLITRDTIDIGEFYFLSHKKTVIPKVILDCIFLKQDQLYSKDNYTKTLKTLSNLIAFKFVTADYVKVNDRDNYLNCIINLTPGKKQSFNIEAQANISQEGYFGLSGLVSYKDKNLTHRSDLLAIDFTPSVQFQFGKGHPVWIITEDFAPSISYYFNKFLFPFKKKFAETLKDKSPRTHLSVKYNYENRYDFDSLGRRQFFYTLHGFNASFGYEWNKNAFIRHVLNPINFTLFLLPSEGPYFTSRLNENPTLKSSYQSQIIFGPSYTFTYTNQRTKADRKYMFFRTSLETAGNILMAGFELANIGMQKHLPYEILKKEFSEYVRGEFDLRGYVKLDNHTMFAGRSFFGIAIPYGNSTAIPFTKQFSVGGPTSLRGFQIREVGPGGYLDPNYKRNTYIGYFNQTGDMKMEANLEFRYDIFKWIKGALFTDMGNVWLIKKDAATPLGEFAFNRFWKEFAIDVGAGVRLDFNYFVIRLDYGIAIRNPSIPGNDKWHITETNLGPGVFQLAVGYPF